MRSSSADIVLRLVTRRRASGCDRALRSIDMGLRRNGARRSNSARGPRERRAEEGRADDDADDDVIAGLLRRGNGLDTLNEPVHRTLEY
jgi:hypothetical protein